MPLLLQYRTANQSRLTAINRQVFYKTIQTNTAK